MILRKLILNNFKKYKSKTFLFEEGLIGIIGKNGSGKSTIFDGILFALYGELKTKGFKETIRTSGCDTKDVVSAELEFEFDSNQYFIKREFRGKSLSANAKITKNAQELATGAKEVTNEVIRTIKMNKDAFLHTLFASQKELTSLSSLKNEDRKKMIRKLLGLEKIDFIESLVTDKRISLKNIIDSYREILLSDDKKIELLDSIKGFNSEKTTFYIDRDLKTKELKSLEITIKNDKKLLEQLQETKDLKQKLLNSIELIKQNQKISYENRIKLENELKDLDLKLKDLKTKEHIKKEYLDLLAELKNQTKQKEISIKKQALEKEQIGLKEQYAKSKTEILLLEEQCKDYEKIVVQIQSLIIKLTDIKKNLLSLEEKEKTIIENIAAENRVINDTQTKILKLKSIGKTSNCPTCTRALLEEYDNVINSLNMIIQEIQKEKLTKLDIDNQVIKKEIIEIKKEKESKEVTLKDLENKKNLIESKQKDLVLLEEYFKKVTQKGEDNKKELETLQEFTYDSTKHSNLETKEKDLKKVYEEILKLEEGIKRLVIVEKDLKSLKEKEELLLKDLKTIEDKNNSVVYDKNSHQTKQKEYENLIKTKDLKVGELNNINISLAQIDGKINTINVSLEKDKEQQKLLIKQKEDLADFEKIKQSLVEFKTKLNSKIAPRISDIASKMYSQITEGRYQHMEVNNEFDFFIYDDGIKYSIDRFSGGEIDLANLVLRIAISKTLSELNGFSIIGFLAFDEVFGSQDESRRMEILEAFYTIKEQYRQIFLISHEIEIKEMFERVIEV